MKKMERRALASCLAVCLALAAGTSGVLASDGVTAGAKTEGYYQGRPNYRYTAMGKEISDPLFSLQWGLQNDGSFTLEEKKNNYPVFDNPFEDPWERGQWRVMGNDAAAMESRQAVSSVPGVDINIEAAWEQFNTNGAETIVALIDTGVDDTNEQLSDAIWTNEGEIAGDGVDNDGNGYIDDVHGWNFYDENSEIFAGENDSHGTHGASTMVAKRDGEGTAGTAGSSNVKIMVLKALGGEDGSGTTESIVEAIKYAEANGASVCNLSLGTTASDRTLYEAMAGSDMLFVAAAGNGTGWSGTGSNTDRMPTYPAAWNLDNLISVANLQPDGTLHYSSNYGARTIDIAAPGSYILGLAAGGQYSYMTGTSMAAPMVSGVAAMLYSQYGDLTAAEARNIILSTAKTLPGLIGKVRTSAMLDAGAALSYDRTLNAPSLSPSPGSGDKTALPGGEAAAGKGSAPMIGLVSSVTGDQGILRAKITDVDGDLKTVRYAAGQKSAAWFQQGLNGKSFSLDQDGMGAFTYTEGGTFTFYASDGQGNETVAVVTLSAPKSRALDINSIVHRIVVW